ncbi:MAG TPA: phosphatase PAP2 family protein [Bryobacteraceae bacterium]|nr:phosphatase PAP2 family protein [Bryobacteraceae bacterium]
MNRFLEWLGEHEAGLLLTLVAIAAGVWLFGALASDVGEGETRNFDTRILLSMRRPGDLAPIGPPGVVEAARDITALGSMVVLGILTFSTAIFLTLDGKARLALFLAVSISAGAVLSLLLKDAFDRPRPEIVPHAAYASNSSFPSGHSMMAALTYMTLGAMLAADHKRKRLKSFFLLIPALLVLLIGVSRVYLGVHWPTDVLAGWTAGGTWALISLLVVKRLQRRQTLEPEET